MGVSSGVDQLEFAELLFDSLLNLFPVNLEIFVFGESLSFEVNDKTTKGIKTNQ